MTAIEKLKEIFITEDELANLLGIDPKRIRDLRSYHMKGKQQFIDHIKPSAKCVLFHYGDVLNWLNNCDVCSFGKTATSLKDGWMKDYLDNEEEVSD